MVPAIKRVKDLGGFGAPIWLARYYFLVALLLTFATLLEVNINYTYQLTRNIDFQDIVGATIDCLHPAAPYMWQACTGFPLLTEGLGSAKTWWTRNGPIRVSTKTRKLARAYKREEPVQVEGMREYLESFVPRPQYGS